MRFDGLEMATESSWSTSPSGCCLAPRRGRTKEAHRKLFTDFSSNSCHHHHHQQHCQVKSCVEIEIEIESKMARTKTRGFIERDCRKRRRKQRKLENLGEELQIKAADNNNNSNIAQRIFLKAAISELVWLSLILLFSSMISIELTAATGAPAALALAGEY